MALLKSLNKKGTCIAKKKNGKNAYSSTWKN